MLIKNNRGDWGILVGYWEGYQKEQKGERTFHFQTLVPGTC